MTEWAGWPYEDEEEEEEDEDENVRLIDPGEAFTLYPKNWPSLEVCKHLKLFLRTGLIIDLTCGVQA